MEDEAQNRLKKMITRYGQSVVEDEQRCKNIMGDYFGNEHRPEIKALTTVLNEQVVKAIMTPPHGFPIEVWLLSQKQKVMDECGLREEVAMWAVESWALALGVIDVP